MPNVLKCPKCDNELDTSCEDDCDTCLRGYMLFNQILMLPLCIPWYFCVCMDSVDEDDAQRNWRERHGNPDVCRSMTCRPDRRYFCLECDIELHLIRTEDGTDFESSDSLWKVRKSNERNWYWGCYSVEDKEWYDWQEGNHYSNCCSEVLDFFSCCWFCRNEPGYNCEGEKIGNPFRNGSVVRRVGPVGTGLGFFAAASLASSKVQDVEITATKEKTFAKGKMVRSKNSIEINPKSSSTPKYVRVKKLTCSPASGVDGDLSISGSYDDDSSGSTHSGGSLHSGPAYGSDSGSSISIFDDDSSVSTCDSKELPFKFR